MLGQRMFGQESMKGTSWNRLVRSAAIALVAIGTLFVSVIANAACGDPAATKSGVALKLPFLAQPNGEDRRASSNNSIVGLWHVTYDTAGQLFYESFDQWHSDGTEIHELGRPPQNGDICLGVWEKTGRSRYKLNHFALGNAVH